MNIKITANDRLLWKKKQACLDKRAWLCATNFKSNGKHPNGLTILVVCQFKFPNLQSIAFVGDSDANKKKKLANPNKAINVYLHVFFFSSVLCGNSKFVANSNRCHVDSELNYCMFRCSVRFTSHAVSLFLSPSLSLCALAWSWST